MWRQKVLRICIGGILLLSVVLIPWSVIERAREAERAPASWKQLRVGVSTQEVTSLIGPPRARTIWAATTPPEEDWFYAFCGTNSNMPFGRNVVTFKTGTVARVAIR
jgi:hypothetical protein